jgi:Protein of unknown function (DUF3182)
VARGKVVAYYGELGGRLTAHQKAMLEADAEAIARLKGSAFAGVYEDARDYSAPLYFVPDDTLLVPEAKSLGIQDEQGLFGGVVPHPFVKTKSVTHPLVDESAERPDGWTPRFTERVHDVVLPGYTAFNGRDACRAAGRMLSRGPLRVKWPLAADGKGQSLVASVTELEEVLEMTPQREIATYGVVLEADLHDVSTLSVGRIVIDGIILTYHGSQRLTTDNEGRSVYGGSNLVCVRGGWDALDRVFASDEIRVGIDQAKVYDEAMSEYPDFFASRRNYDVGQGIDADGRWRSGVFEPSWRVGGATSAELVAVNAFLRDPDLRVIEVAHVEEFGSGREAPPDAVVHFRGDDPKAGPLLRYTVVHRARPSGAAQSIPRQTFRAGET